MKRQKGYTLTEIIVVLVVLAGGFGWIWNIAIGIFVFPVGMVVGYF